MEAGGGNLHQPAEHAHRVGSPFTGDEGVLHLDSLVKNTVAFFRMSRSILSVAFSDRRRLSSLSSSLVGWRLGERRGWPDRDAVNQLASDLTEISRCLAATRPMDSASLMAWDLQSLV